MSTFKFLCEDGFEEPIQNHLGNLKTSTEILPVRIFLHTPGIRALTFTLVHTPACMQLPRQEMEEFCAVLLLSNSFSVSSRVAFRVIISQLAIILHIFGKK